jgi:UDP-galactopyranose mutase
MPAIIVFSHLRWDFVFQRPQHLLSRLGEYYPIIFVEEPVYHEGESFFKIYTPAPNVHVYQPHTSVAMAGFHDDQLPQLRKLMRQLVADYSDHIAWFYTPMALPLLQELDPRTVVYDCMDELAAFKNAPKQLLQRESGLLKVADVVFTGGPSLYRAKCERHPNVHCFPSSVDVVHFSQALDRSNSHPAHRDIPGPRLGFYGVIDERFDLDLIAKVADAHPQWQLVLVGPVVKIDPAALPQRANIHYLGQQPYDALPQFLAGWDVCLLPFALNESTRFISPTKTLEYMAAERPAVSTPITDVVDLYGEVVSIATDAASFIAACEAALLATPQEYAQKIIKMRKIVESTSWEATARSMHELLDAHQAADSKEVRELPVPAEPNTNVNALRKPTTMRNVKCAIIGAGPTGLSAAYHLDKDTLLLDKNSSVGGWCRSIQDKGFTFDYAGHIMFSNDPYVLKLYQTLLGNNLHWQNREAWIYSKNVFTRYPFQGALYGLPPSVIKECVVGAMEARYGSLKTPDVKCVAANAQEAGDVKDTIDTEVADCCADGTVTLPAATNIPSSSFVPLENRSPGNFEEFIYKTWGAGIAKHFAIPYNRKLWTVPLNEMETSWLGGRVPLPDLEEIIEGALEPVGKPMGPNARFGYPLRGGFQALMSGFLPHIKGSIELNADVVSVSPREHLIALADGRRFCYEHLISTMPLPELIKLIGEEAPPEVRTAARGLRHISVRCVNLGIARENITDKHWIYYPEDTVFHRIFVQGNASPECNPPGGFALTCEISYSPTKPLPCDGQSLIARCVDDLTKVGLLNPDDRLITANQVDMPYAYVLYDHARARNVAIVKAWLAEYDILLSGRYSEWEYYNSDHAFIAGKKAAEAVKWMQPKKSALAE